jgi:hypothetical protein
MALVAMISVILVFGVKQSAAVNTTVHAHPDVDIPGCAHTRMGTWEQETGGKGC